MNEPIVISGVAARLPGKKSWFEKPTEKIRARWPAGFIGIKNDVGKGNKN